MPAVNIDQTPEAWNKFVPGYEKTFETLTSQYARDVLGLLDLRPGYKVIDVAAGLGAFSLLAAKTGANVLATDFSPDMISKLRERILSEGLINLTAEVMDGQALKVRNRTFDVSVSILGVIFFPDIGKGFSELKRVLKPGGRCAVVCFGDMKNFKLMTELEKAVKTILPGFQRPEQNVSSRLTGADPLKAEMEKAGFHDIQIRTTTHSFKITSPQVFWDNLAPFAPPVVGLFEKIGPEKTAEIGRVFVESLSTPDQSTELGAEACIGLGRA